jgi:Fic family protein
MNIIITKTINQPQVFRATVPLPFPPKGIFDVPVELLIKATEAERLIGKLDGITQTLPDIDFFLKMFVAKDAESSAQIEGTRATLIDAIEKAANIDNSSTDAEDILFYIKALNYGIKRSNNFPFTLRFIREIHSQLLTGARSSHFADPGEFRRSQNWIGGTKPSEAVYVPPPVEEMNRSLNDFEKFINTDNLTLPLILIGLAHAQFETIHPFLDGNGRTGRLLITLLLYKNSLLEHPVLFLSSYFKKHQQLYYSKINGYHKGYVDGWLNFFLDGVIETARESIQISEKIRRIRDEDTNKLISLAKRESESGINVLNNLFGSPIITTKTIMDWTGFSRNGAQKLIDRFLKLSIIDLVDQNSEYDRKYKYSKYLKAFTD